MFAGYPHLADKITPITIQAYLIALADCSPWAVDKVIEALRKGLVQTNIDYCPSAPLIASEARKWDEARKLFKGGSLEAVEKRLASRAADALPSPSELSERQRRAMSKKVLDLAESMDSSSLGAKVLKHVMAGDDPEARDD